MKSFKKACYIIIGLVSVLGLCFVAICFLYPSLTGKNNQGNPPTTGENSDSDSLQKAHDALEGTMIESSALVADSTHDSGLVAESDAIASQESNATASSSSAESNTTASQESSATASSSSAESNAAASQESSATASSSSAESSSASQESKATASSAASESASQESKATASSVASESASQESKVTASSAAESSSAASQESNATESSTAASNQEIIVDGHKDQSAPVFLSFTSSPQIKVGNDFNIHKYIGYADDVDRNVDLEVTGTVDTSKEGNYPLTIVLRDDAGHKTTKEMKVQVVTKTSSSSGSSKKEAFSDFVKNYKTDNTSVGIDVSRWQETIDFEKVKAAGCEFVYMRLGGYDNGELYTDRYFKQNLAGAKAAGLKIGIYWHSEESTPAEVKASINYMMDVLNGEKLDFPIAFDWEDFINFENYNMNLYDINHIFDVFVQEIESHEGYTACMYGSKNKLETLWTLDPNRAVWLAHYTSATSYTGKYFMWQHSCTGRIDGINGDVDLDVFYH